MTTAARHREGFTLIEAIAVVGLLLAFLLPAAQSARESARLATCRDHLRQVGLALQSHAAANQALPSLYNGTFLPQPRQAPDEFHFHSWRTAILPQVERSALFNQLNLGQPSTFEANQTAMGGVAVARQAKISTNLDVVRLGARGEPTYKVDTDYSLAYRKARLADITDGLSNTILVAERAEGPDEYRKGKPVLLQRDQSPGGGTHQAAWAVSTHFFWLVSGLGRGVNDSNMTGIYAFYRGGANVGLDDGSVHFLKETTAPEVLKGLITRSGPEVATFQ